MEAEGDFWVCCDTDLDCAGVGTSCCDYSSMGVPNCGGSGFPGYCRNACTEMEIN
jgi:hypothetical protein